MVTATASVAIVVPAGPPVINLFDARPSEPITGQLTLLRWNVSSAEALTSLVLSADDGSSDVALSGLINTRSVTPQQDTVTYTVTATSDAGSDSAQFVVQRVPASTAAPKLVYELNRNVTTADRGFPMFEGANMLANGNWETPFSYARGMLYYRVIVTSQPVPQADMKLSFCAWQSIYTNRLGLENCGPSRTVPGDSTAPIVWSGLVSDMWKLGGNPIEWDRARSRWAFAIKNGADCPVSNYNISPSLAVGCPIDETTGYLLAWAGEDPDAWYPLNIRLTVCAVAQGDTFDPNSSANWDSCTSN